jgi:hypothetical protein
MSDVLSQVSAQSAQEIDVSEIADSEIADRFDVSEGLADLIESIRASGQQLPALLRYRRGSGPRYEVVYGRRRIAACRALGIKVKAYIKEMDQRAALAAGPVALPLATTAKPPAPLHRLGKTPVGYKSKGQRLLIEVSDKAARGFISFVEERLDRLYDEWKAKP